MPAWFLLMLPQLLAGLGKLVGSKSAINSQNRYNSPIQQMARIKEAGLPFAAFANGQAGNQSSLPDLGGWDTIGNSFNTSIQQSNQIKMFQELLRGAMADADVKENLRDVSNEETIGQLGYTYKDPNGNQVPIARVGKLLDFQLKEYGAWSAKYKKEMDEIDKLIKESRYDSGALLAQAEAEFNSIIEKNKLMSQQWSTNEAKSAAFNKVIDFMKGSDGQLGFVESLLILLAGSLGGGFSKGGVNFGF